MSMRRSLLARREAVAACGVSRSTIRRRREAGDLPGCVRDEERGWLIPVDALLAAGFRLNAPAPPEDAAGADADGWAARGLETTKPPALGAGGGVPAGRPALAAGLPPL
ncbi:AlpA family transcriptional regulator [Streptomyces sp. NE5-10]|uniref:helix-turn-helix transcriptional regulator n=1 Tax=Streptomyces sp. NE5-10 TaxID=2759674 RepID=UPI00190374BD|nr:hypothetical protein [Streptomyces sp. NE5-10]